MRFILATMASFLTWSVSALADEVQQNTVNAVGAPAKTDAEPGKEMFCHEFGAFRSEPAKVSECFPLRLMNNPRIGAKWGGKMKPDINYLAEVLAGRPNAPKTLTN